MIHEQKPSARPSTHERKFSGKCSANTNYSLHAVTSSPSFKKSASTTKCRRSVASTTLLCKANVYKFTTRSDKPHMACKPSSQHYSRTEECTRQQVPEPNAHRQAYSFGTTTTCTNAFAAPVSACTEYQGTTSCSRIRLSQDSAHRVHAVCNRSPDDEGDVVVHNNDIREGHANACHTLEHLSIAAISHAHGADMPHGASYTESWHRFADSEDDEWAPCDNNAQTAQQGTQQDIVQQKTSVDPHHVQHRTCIDAYHAQHKTTIDWHHDDDNKRHCSGQAASSSHSSHIEHYNTQATLHEAVLQAAPKANSSDVVSRQRSAQQDAMHNASNHTTARNTGPNQTSSVIHASTSASAAKEGHAAASERDSHTHDESSTDGQQASATSVLDRWMAVWEEAAAPQAHLRRSWFDQSGNRDVGVRTRMHSKVEVRHASHVEGQRSRHSHSHSHAAAHDHSRSNAPADAQHLRHMRACAQGQAQGRAGRRHSASEQESWQSSARAQPHSTCTLLRATVRSYSSSPLASASKAKASSSPSWRPQYVVEPGAKASSPAWRAQYVVEASGASVGSTRSATEESASMQGETEYVSCSSSSVQVCVCMFCVCVLI
jgi:hypothetical protein